MLDLPLEGGEAVVAIWQAVARLPIDLREALLLREVFGLSYAEIGDVLQVSLPTVRWRIFASRERLMLALVRADIADGEPTDLDVRLVRSAVRPHRAG